MKKESREGKRKGAAKGVGGSFKGSAYDLLHVGWQMIARCWYFVCYLSKYRTEHTLAQGHHLWLPCALCIFLKNLADVFGDEGIQFLNVYQGERVTAHIYVLLLNVNSLEFVL